MSITYLGKPGNYGLSDNRWRYIEYDNGDNELYDIESDRYEWMNLAAKPEYAQQVARLRSHAPVKYAKFAPASDAALPKLTWHPAGDATIPASKPDGEKFDVVFTNKRKELVEIYWMDRHGKQKSYGALRAGRRKRHKTRPGAVWLIADDEESPLGYFVIGDRTAQAVIPPRIRKSND